MKFLKSISLFLLSASTVVTAFEATVPCLIWSPKDFVASKASNQLVLSQADATQSIFSHLSLDVCSAKVIAIVNQPQLHSNDLVNYRDSFSQLIEHSNAAKSRAQFEYISNGVDIDQLSKMIARHCDTPIAILDASSVSTEDFKSSVVAIVPLESANNNNNAQVLKSNDELLGQFINTVQEKVQDDYVVIYTSSEPKEKRVLERRAVPVKSQDAPIFGKYQLFTPGVFMVLGVVLLLLFIAGTGITWLVGIQTPVRIEAKQKKN